MKETHQVSTLIVGKFTGDTDKFRQALDQRGEEFAAIGERARRAGCLHHRFGIGDGFVTVIDEWESPEQFQRFFSDPELQAFIASAGAAAGPPELWFTDAVSSPDQF
jgi:quinol monooxygenase YgiN